jgi:hypothetical protein
MGWVNRIRVSTTGYGKALYIKHYDGTTSVYAHLKKFAPKIEAYVKERQYQKESFTIHLFLKNPRPLSSRGGRAGWFLWKYR